MTKKWSLRKYDYLNACCYSQYFQRFFFNSNPLSFNLLLFYAHNSDLFRDAVEWFETHFVDAVFAVVAVVVAPINDTYYFN